MTIKFANLDIESLQQIFGDCTQQELHELIEYVDDVAQKRECLPFDIKKKYSVKKQILINYLISVFMSQESILNIYKELSKSEVSEYIYKKLIWESEKLETSEIAEKFNYKFSTDVNSYYGVQTTNLQNELALVVRKKSPHYSDSSDTLSINTKFKTILKLVFPIPKDYELEAVSSLEETKYSYTNEEGVLDFITVIEGMLKNRLVEFGKTNEKPLSKTLNILKSSTGVKEFYNETTLNSFATDMLTRSFYYYEAGVEKFEQPAQNALKHFVLAQFGDQFSFFITRIFLGHLKKVRYDSYYSSQRGLFNALLHIIKEMPEDDYVSVENIIKFCKYRDFNLDIEAKYKTDEYNMDIKAMKSANMSVTSIYANTFHNEIVFEPMLKASLFYIGALGLMELKYNDPVSPYNISAKDKPYISPWDSLKYVKLTKLGKYIFGFSESYAYEKKEIKKTTIKFDEYKPIITVDKQDVIMQAKLDQYTEKQGDYRYILSHAKIFKDCKNKKALELKIDGFYKQIEANPPQVFKDFFDEIMTNADMLKKDSKHVVIELNNNKKLLNLFMKNKKLQEIIIKAQGYRIMVLKDNLSKLTKIVKDNGFFIEF